VTAGKRGGSSCGASQAQRVSWRAGELVGGAPGDAGFPLQGCRPAAPRQQHAWPAYLAAAGQRLHQGIEGRLVEEGYAVALPAQAVDHPVQRGLVPGGGGEAGRAVRQGMWGWAPWLKLVHTAAMVTANNASDTTHLGGSCCQPVKRAATCT
jgi:hypothetical protein